MQTVPAGMAEQKIRDTHQSPFRKGVGLHGDINGAYLTILLGGVIKFLYLFPAIPCGFE